MWKHREDYERKDKKGRWINIEFPPESFERYPHTNGYKTENEEALYYQYVLQCYNLRINYKGEEYLALVGTDESCITDPDFNQISESYPTPIDLIKNYRFPDGKSLPDIVQNDTDVVIDLI